MGLVAITAYYFFESALAAMIAIPIIVIGRQDATAPIPRWSSWASAFMLALILVIGVSYLLSPGFFDYGEPVIPILARNLVNGAPVYSDPRGGALLVGSNYGPGVFLLQAPGLWAKAGAFGAKLPGTLAGLGAIALTYETVRRSGADCGRAMLLSAFCAACFASQLNRWCWDRPDSFLCLLSAGSSFAAVSLEPAAALVIIGFAGGCATDLKIFGALYVFPGAAYALARAEAPARTAVAASASVLAGVAIALAPFALPSLSLNAYLSNLFIMPHQGYDLRLTWSAASALTLMLVAPLSVRAENPSIRGSTAFTTALIVAGAVVCLIAGKPGGGAIYALPFAPAASVLGSLRWPRQDKAATRRSERNVLIAFMCAAICSVPCAAFGAWKLMDMRRDRAAERAALLEVRKLTRAHPEAEFTYPDGRAERLYLRSERAFSGATTRFDYVNYIDQRIAGVPSARIRALFENCAIPAWISVAGRAPWSGRDWQRGQLVVEPVDAELFRRTYQRAESGTAFDLWTCRAVPQTGASRRVG